MLDSSIAKYYCTETAYAVADRCLQVFGGMGLLREGPVERILRHLRVLRVVEGATEVQKLVDRPVDGALTRSPGPRQRLPGGRRRATRLDRTARRVEPCREEGEKRRVAVSLRAGAVQQPGSTAGKAPGGFGPNEWLVDEIYQQYLRDPNSVDPAWWDFFADYKPPTSDHGRSNGR